MTAAETSDHRLRSFAAGVSRFLLAAVLLVSVGRAVAEEPVTVISSGGTEIQSREAYRSSGTQLYFSYSPLSSYVVPSRRAPPSPYLSGWNHLAPSQYWQKKIGQRDARARYTLGDVSRDAGERSGVPQVVDWWSLKDQGPTSR